MKTEYLLAGVSILFWGSTASVMTLMAGGLSSFATTMIYYVVSALVILPVLLWREGLPVLTLSQWGGALWMGVLSNGLSYATWAMAMDRGDPAKLSNLAYLTPFVSLVYIYFLLHEPIGWTSLAGLFFIMLGVAVQMLPARAGRSADRSVGS